MRDRLPSSVVQTSPSRQGYVDFARTAATVAVILIHIASAQAGDAHGSSWYVATFFLTTTRWAVPLFILISGALLLDPARRESPTEFYRRRLLRIGVPLVFWTVFYLCWRRWFLHEHLTPWMAMRQAAFGTPYYHLYFLFLIAGLYMITPVLRIYVQFESMNRQVWAATIALTWTASVALLAMVFKQHNDPLGLTMFSSSVGYYLMGHVIAARGLPDAWYRRGSAIFIGSALLSFAGAVATQRIGTHHIPKRLFTDYTNAIVIFMSIGIFLTIIRAVPERGDPSRPLPGAMAWLSSASFGIYLIHPVVIDLLRRSHVSFLRPHALIAIPVWAAVVLLISLVLTQGIRKVPGLRAVVG